MVPYTLAGIEFSWRKVRSFQQILKEFHDPDKVQDHCRGNISFLRALPRGSGQLANRWIHV